MIFKVLTNGSFTNFSKVETKNEKSNILRRFRFVIILNFIKDVPFDLDKNKNYYLEYFILDQKVRSKIDINVIYQKGSANYIAINKIKLFYFFSSERKDVNFYLTEQKVKNYKF